MRAIQHKAMRNDVLPLCVYLALVVFGQDARAIKWDSAL